MKSRYAALDALRGVAALFVAAYHFSEYFREPWSQFSFLAVDLFFGLSGFVLAANYDNARGRAMGAKEFLVRRAIRLYPLYLVGVALAAMHPSLYRWGGGHLALPALSTALLMLPSPTWRYFPALFPVLQPAWSLFFELFVANVAFAFTMGRCSFRFIAAIVVVSGVAYAAVALRQYAMFPDRASFDIGVRWSDAIGGFPRTLFSFFAGVLLYRIHARSPRTPAVPAWIVVGIFVLLMIPRLQGVPMQIYQVVCIFGIFPLIIYFGATSIERSPWLGNLLGEASFALYTIHAPLIGFWVIAAQHLPLRLSPEMSLAGFLFCMVPLALILARADTVLRQWIAGLRAERRATAP